MSTRPSGARSAGIREVDVTEVLRDYGRYFIGPDMADAFAQGLLALERNWRGPLLTNAAVDVDAGAVSGPGAHAPRRSRN